MSKPRLAFLQPTLNGFGGFEKYGMHVVEALSPAYSVDVISLEDSDKKKVERSFDVDLSLAQFRTDRRCRVRLDLNRLARWKAQRELAALSREYDLLISNNFETPEVCYCRRGILVNHSTITRHHKLEERSGSWLSSLTSRGRVQSEIRKRVDSWTKVVTNSEFTRQSFRNYWRRDSTVIYPPVAAPSNPINPEREKVILGCGFFSGLQDSQGRVTCGIKRQDLLIQAFRLLVDRGIRDHTLVLAGHYDDEPQSRMVLDQLKASAEGLPVQFRLNVPHSEMMGIYQNALLFWQATGFGKHPDQDTGAVETFGMALVEALGSGCPGLAYDAGGAAEILAPISPSLVWRTLEELCSRSLELLTDRSAYNEIGLGASKRAMDFSPDRFRRHWLQVVSEVLA